MSINRVLLHFNSASKSESRYDQAVRWREQAQAVVDRIEAVVGGDALRWWLMSSAFLADNESPFCMQVMDGGFNLNIEDPQLESVSAMLIEALREQASECANAADKIELLIADGGES
jgi:hypothetical protein